MRNKRTLKREIRTVCTALLAECEAVRLYGKATDADMQALTLAVLRAYGNAVCRISHPEPGMKASAYFKDLRVNLSQQLDEIVEQINALA